MPSTTTTANESFANIGGLTQTTPTLTPTTLKNLEEQFMEIIPPQPRHHPQEARFVPPLVNISANYASLQVSNQNDLNNNSSNNSNSNTSDFEYGSDYETDDSSSQSSMQWNAYCDRNNSSANNSNQMSDNNSNTYNRSVKTNGKTRGRSGRKPTRNEKLTPEEEKKRQQRRERNKQAAARCRKRRMDHTNQLLMETDGLEDKKHALLNEIEDLRKQKEELEYILEAHKTNCKVSAHKPQHIDVKPMVNNGNVITKSRPNSLPLPCIYSDPGIPIQTPSSGLFLDSMEGTGLTPILNPTLTPSIITPTVTSCGTRLKSSPMESPTLKKLVPL